MGALWSEATGKKHKKCPKAGELWLTFVAGEVETRCMECREVVSLVTAQEFITPLISQIDAAGRVLDILNTTEHQDAHKLVTIARQKLIERLNFIAGTLA